MLTVRMNWMDVEGSTSADVLLPKDSKDIPPHLRNKLYNHRAQVASLIRRQLAHIKRQLDGDADKEHDDATKAVEAITALIKGQNYRDGKTFTCYLDGTSHEGCRSVTAYNAHCRQRLDDLLEANPEITAKVPDASEFDVKSIDDMMDEEAICADANDRVKLQEKIEAARNQYNDKASKCSRYLSSFMAIRNAKLGEGFDPHAAEEEDVLAYSYAARSSAKAATTNQQEEDASADEGEEEATEEVQEGSTSAVITEETNVIEAPRKSDEVAAENDQILETTLGERPAMRDGTVAPNSDATA